MTHDATGKATGAAAPVAFSPVRVVLDTNVVVALYVFADPRLQALHERLANGAWRALADERGLAEYRRVLAYPQFGLAADDQTRAFEAYRRLAEYAAPAVSSRPPLPRCKDPDDQKFLELARDGAAALLITRDKALLRLARNCRRHCGFRILSPIDAAPAA